MWLMQYRDLIWNLTITDLKVKYQSSVLGFAWSLLNPLLMMLVLFFVFANVFRFNQEHFALYILVGIIAWRFLANGTSTAMLSIVAKPSLVTKIFIPRHILVLSSTLSTFISSILEFCVLIPLLFVFGANITPYILFFPIAHAIFFFIVYGLSLVLAALYVYYRDLNQIWEVVIQLGFFLAPICYPITIVPPQFLPYYVLNPVTILIETYRNFLIYGLPPGLRSMVYLVISAALLMIFGKFVFNRLERRFAEVI
ncbi:MAG: ABC-2 type transporter [Methanoregulaceae archaeon PtaB.Bin056]|jgi:lipopolysaccharide transport system permease protein|nr:MAG: ABC-2 type transporter [Methanoregulaceae archaeon PtaB.Bin056]